MGLPEHLRALIVILFLATVVFSVSKTPACAKASASLDFRRRRNLWFGITVLAFVAHNYWIYIVAGAAILLFAQSREQNKLAMFFLLLFAVPAIPAKITGLGIVEYFFTIHYYRLLSLTILLPAFLLLRRQPDTEPFGRSGADKFLASYLALLFVLQMSVDTTTNTLRHALFYAFTDVFLPYYVASRSLKSLQMYRDAFMAIAIAAMVLGTIGIIESAKGWLLYSSLDRALGVAWVTRYLARGENLRALGSVGQAIPLGFVMAVALGLFLFLRRSVPTKMAWWSGALLLATGLIAPFSRGPWLGAVTILLVFIATGPTPTFNFVRLGMVSLVALPILLISPLGGKIIDYLPYVGTVDAHNVTYREELFDVSVQVIKQNPFFGRIDFRSTPEIQSLRTGEGIIDIVNTYLAVALGSGLVGLILFCGFFIVVALEIVRTMTKIPDKTREEYLLGRVLISCLLGILIVLFTVSSITVIPFVYWSVAGLGVSYGRLLKRPKASNGIAPIELMATEPQTKRPVHSSR